MAGLVRIRPFGPIRNILGTRIHACGFAFSNLPVQTPSITVLPSWSVNENCAVDIMDMGGRRKKGVETYVDNLSSGYSMSLCDDIPLPRLNQHLAQTHPNAADSCYSIPFSPFCGDEDGSGPGLLAQNTDHNPTSAGVV